MRDGRKDAERLSFSRTSTRAGEPEAYHYQRVSADLRAVFYNADGRRTKPLFAAVTSQLGISAVTKEDGLRALQRSGWLLVDATYQPVNGLSPSGRDRIIAQSYPLLLGDLKKLSPDRQTPLILIKANVCRILGLKLKADGFNILDRDRPIYFPAGGHQKEFRRQFAQALQSSGTQHR